MRPTDVPALVHRLTGAPPRAVRSGNRVVLADGQQALLKSAIDQPGQVAAEVAGLRWLAEASAVPIPRVLGYDDSWLLLAYLPPARPDRPAARRFGANLARMHAAGAPAFGAPPPGGPVDAWIGRAPMRNRAPAEPEPTWARWYVADRVLPYLRTARDAGQLTAAQAAEVEAAASVIEEVAGPEVPPARLHGDLWSGNVCWSRGDTDDGSDGSVEAWLIDPAAHGGHPETDLAMLALFGCPELDAVLEGYQEVSPLAEGWRARVGLHQLFPLLVHTVLFGSGYAGQAVAAARSVLRLAERIP